MLISLVGAEAGILMADALAASGLLIFPLPFPLLLLLLMLLLFDLLALSGLSLAANPPDLGCIECGKAAAVGADPRCFQLILNAPLKLA